MMSPPWNNFLRIVLCFVVVRFDHDERLGIISFRPIFLILWWQKEEGRHKKEVSQLHLHEYWLSFVGHMFSGLLSSVRLCGYPYESSYMFGFEIWSYTQHGYNIDEDQFLDIRSVFQSACNVMMYSAII